ncbi:MAG: hypothetical protein ACYC4H_03840 [Desulfocucumaceae bacterium]
MSSSGSSFKSYSREESLKFWVGDRRPDFEGGGQAAAGLILQSDQVELSDQAKAMLEQSKAPLQASPEDDKDIFTISDKDRLKITLIERMMECLTGKKFKFLLLDKVKMKSSKEESKMQLREALPRGPRRQGWGLEYDYRESIYEQEKMTFEARGIIKTADGREIAFSVDLSMSREFAAQNNVRIRAGDAAVVDPLVINFDGKAPELTEMKYSFDLDSDGSEDRISFIGPGSGFLALDINGDGRVNDGRELFGPDTGDGFAELARYDEDGNNWIDENDPIYSRLRIWIKDAEGNDMLMALGQKGIGAIYLGNIMASFEMKDEGNNLQGQVRKAGICVKEDGSVATVQQIDLVV